MSAGKNKREVRLNSLYIKLTSIILFITTWFCPYNARQYDIHGIRSFGIPFAYLDFPDNMIKESLWSSTGINIFYLYLDFVIIYYIIKFIGKVLIKIRSELPLIRKK